MIFLKRIQILASVNEFVLQRIQMGWGEGVRVSNFFLLRIQV